jgi:hypothetical protein
MWFFFLWIPRAARHLCLSFAHETPVNFELLFCRFPARLRFFGKWAINVVVLAVAAVAVAVTAEEAGR